MYLDSAIMKVYFGSVKKKLKNKTKMTAEINPNKYRLDSMIINTTDTMNNKRIFSYPNENASKEKLNKNERMKIR